MTDARALNLGSQRRSQFDAPSPAALDALIFKGLNARANEREPRVFASSRSYVVARYEANTVVGDVAAAVK